MPIATIEPGLTPSELREKRNEFILKYHSLGITPRSIMDMLKAQEKDTGWEAVSEVSIKKVIIEHFKQRRMLMRGVDGKDNEKAMQEAMLEQQERFLERLIITYNKHENNKTFKNLFEQTQLADLINRIRQQIIENRNWNESRKNPLVISESSVFEVNVFEASGEKMIVNGQSPAILQVLSHLKAKFDNSDAVEAEYTEA